MRRAFLNGWVMTPHGAASDRAVLIEGDRIVALTTADDPRLGEAARIDLDGRWLLPGFLDVQVNGGGGVLFNDAPTIATIRAIGAAHAKYGTAGFLPTLISDDLRAVAAAIAAVDGAIAEGVPGVLGIHIEGPFLSEARRGVHDASHFLELDHDSVALLCSLRRGRTLVTLAPEQTRPEVLDRLAEAGVVIAAGHTNATADQVEEARRHGLTGFTHLFNAMSPLTGREPGAVGAALADSDAYCGIIVDGRHVDPRVLRLALRLKSTDRLMLVTDAMPSVGTALETFQLQGRTITVADDVCVDAQGTLAGTALDMSRALRNAVGLLDLPLVEAVRMASETPAHFLGLGATHGRIAPGYRADLVVADDSLHVLETWIGGRRVHPNGEPA